MTKDDFFKLTLLDDNSYARILADNPELERTQLTKWWDEGGETLELIRKSNKLFSSKNQLKEKGNNELFAPFWANKRAFFYWYLEQPRKCCYCGIEEFKLILIFAKENPVLKTKRSRGRSLELERLVPNQPYNKANIALACYLCNNHKSDLISEHDFRKYFAQTIFAYQNDKYNELKNLTPLT